MSAKKAAKKQSKPWSKAEASALLDEVDASGLKDFAYGTRHGISGQKIWWWRRRLGRGRVLQPSADFVEVKALEVAPVEERIEVELQNGRRVWVPLSAPPERVARLLEAIEGRLC